MSSRRSRRIFLAMLLALAWAAPAVAQTKIVVGYGIAADFLPAFVAKEEGMFAKNRLDVTLNAVQNSSLVPAMLAAGNVHIGINTPTNLLLAAEGGLDQVAVAGAARLQKENQRIGLVTRQGVTVAKAEDLKGRKVGIPGINSVIDIFLKKWLIDHKVALSELSLIEAPPPQMGDMLKSGQLDAVAIFEPLMSRFVFTGVGVKSVDFFSEVNPDVVGSFWAATRNWTSANVQAVAAFRTSLAEAQAFIAQNPEKAKQIEAKYLGFAGPRFPTFKLDMQPADLEYFVRIGRELGVIRTQIDTSRLIVK
jgi:NitT/TauT family transport system substrate-binding protein